MRRKWITPVLIVALVAVLGRSAFADDKKVDAVLKLTEGSVAAGIGWSWGHGTRTYMGKSYRVKVEGLTVGEVGMTNAKAKGKSVTKGASLKIATEGLKLQIEK